MSRLPSILFCGLLLAGCTGLKRQLVASAIESRRADAGLTLQTERVGGLDVAYLERPGDGPTVVLVHGFGASKDAWLAYAAALPAGFRVLIPDLPGHGASAADAARPYDAPRLAESVAGLLDGLGVASYHVAGNSLGGQVAALLALERPGRVRSLALYAPAGVSSPVPSVRDSLARTGSYVLIPTDRRELDALYDLVFEEDPDIPGPARDVLADEAAVRAPFLRSLLAELSAQHDLLRPRLHEIGQPALLVWGEEDRILDPSAAAVWADGLPHETLVLMPGVGHAPMMERPETTAAAFAAQVRRVEGGG